MLKLLDTHLYQSGASDHLRHLILYIARSVKYIHYHLQVGDLGAAGTVNPSGEEQLALDVFADQIIMSNLTLSRLVSRVISEEQEQETRCECKDHETFSVAYDPLDGSSLAAANLAIGSIFSIYPGDGFTGRAGREQSAALYALYGPRTTLTYTLGKGVHEFTLNDVGEFTLTKENIEVQKETKYFSPGNLRAASINPKYKALVDYWVENAYTLRYSGGMTPDVNHIFMKGQGIFTYPPFPPKYPEGKLRLLFECNPFAFLMEQAGGKASNGAMEILDVPIMSVHQRTPIYLGSAKEVERVVKQMG